MSGTATANVRPAWRRPTLAQALALVLAVTALSQLALGVVLYGRLRAELEHDLGRRLQHVAGLIALGVDAPLVVQFRAGDERLAAYELVRTRLAEQAEAAGAARAWVSDLELRVLVDSVPAQRPGTVRHALLAHRSEARQAAAGRAQATRLWRDERGELRLSALAPLRGGAGAVVGLVGVEATPDFFTALALVRREMLLLGGAGLALAGLAAAFALRQVSARLVRLRAAVSRAARGGLAARPASRGGDEIGALGRDLDGLIAAGLARRALFESVLADLDVGVLAADGRGEVRLANAALRRLLRLDGPVEPGARARHGDGAAAGEEAPAALPERAERRRAAGGGDATHAAPPAGEIVGRTLDDVLAEVEELRAAAREVRATGRPRSVEVALEGGPAAGGRLLGAALSPLGERDGRHGVIVSLFDLTALAELERRARANERLAGLGSLAGGVLHEVGNPLGAVALYLDLLRPLAPAGEAAELLERALAESARVQEFLDDFRVAAGLRPLRRERVDCGELLAAGRAGLTWRDDVKLAVTGAGHVTSADRRLMAHALRNLLRNAQEALAGRPGRVEVHFTRADGHEQLAVRDDGPGLPPAAARGLEPLRTTKPHGTGLGLALVERVAEAHGGTLRYTSPAEGGALFTLRWPAEE